MSNPWKEEVDKYRKRGMSLKSALVNAKKTYNRKQSSLKKHERSNCPSYQLQEACDTDNECQWNWSKDKCYKVRAPSTRIRKPKKSTTPKKYSRSYCPSYVLQEACDIDDACKWNWKNEKCYKKKRSSPVRKSTPSTPRTQARSKSRPNHRRSNGWNKFVKAYMSSHPGITYKEALISAKKVYRKLSQKKRARKECPGHSSRTSCRHHQGCRWSSKKKSCVEGIRKRTLSHLRTFGRTTSRHISSPRRHSNRRMINIVVVEDKLGKVAKKISSKRRSSNSWKRHVKKYMQKHPGMSLPEASHRAKKTYLKKAKRTSF